ncbi:hypothetical protein GOBAR_AA01411 [Gossypium barbadense]|uniref:Sialate O-acetylesterase domain-containing protein n=1 Tax=Gossypium barbadense TaxID=3634 RepID=A0A2P5YU22_GOSBA|nr:hypothetical protein GOBAR_AA01411 [Gossypium barbadense]
MEETIIPVTEQKQYPQTPKHIFILSGQSNMAGRGGVHHHHWDGVVPLDSQPHASIIRLSAKLHWEPAREPLHHDIDVRKACGVGPGMSFANAEWERGQHLYDNMLKRSKESVEKTKGEIKALLWYQGESDTPSYHTAEAYKENMERLIHNVAIASGDERYMEKVREAQLGIDLPNVICVDAKGLALKEDNLHLTTEAQVKLGHMLADAFLTHFNAPPSQSSPCSAPKTG